VDVEGGFGKKMRVQPADKLMDVVSSWAIEIINSVDPLSELVPLFV